MYIPITVLPPKLMEQNIDSFDKEIDQSQYNIQYDPNDFEDQLSSYYQDRVLKTPNTNNVICKPNSD